MLNKVQIIGRVGKDPEIRYSSSGDAIASFNVATSEKYKDKQNGEFIEKTEWHNVSAFKKLGEIVGQYIKKGALIYIEGKIQTRKYEKDNVTHYATSIIASDLKMLGAKDAGSQQGQSKQSAKPQSTNIGVDHLDDDIPF